MPVNMSVGGVMGSLSTMLSATAPFAVSPPTVWPSSASDVAAARSCEGTPLPPPKATPAILRLKKIKIESKGSKGHSILQRQLGQAGIALPARERKEQALVTGCGQATEPSAHAASAVSCRLWGVFAADDELLEGPRGRRRQCGGWRRGGELAGLNQRKEQGNRRGVQA